MALSAEYGDCWPGAISLIGSSWRMRWPAPASQRVSGARSPMSPMPQLVEDGHENSGISRPAWRRAAGHSWLATGAIEAPQDAIDSVGKLRLGSEQAHDEDRPRAGKSKK